MMMRYFILWENVVKIIPEIFVVNVLASELNLEEQVNVSIANLIFGIMPNLSSF